MKKGTRIRTLTSQAPYFEAGEEAVIVRDDRDGTHLVRFETLREGDYEWYVGNGEMEVVE